MDTITKNILQFGLIKSIIHWLEAREIKNPKLARIICKIIPSQCPFARDIKFFNQTILHIPPLCKFNPFYEQLMIIRFNSLSYLANECGEDITVYC